MSSQYHYTSYNSGSSANNMNSQQPPLPSNIVVSLAYSTSAAEQLLEKAKSRVSLTSSSASPTVSMSTLLPPSSNVDNQTTTMSSPPNYIASANTTSSLRPPLRSTANATTTATSNTASILTQSISNLRKSLHEKVFASDPVVAAADTSISSSVDGESVSSPAPTSAGMKKKRKTTTNATTQRPPSSTGPKKQSSSTISSTYSSPRQQAINQSMVVRHHNVNPVAPNIPSNISSPAMTNTPGQQIQTHIPLDQFIEQAIYNPNVVQDSAHNYYGPFNSIPSFDDIHNLGKTHQQEQQQQPHQSLQGQVQQQQHHSSLISRHQPIAVASNVNNDTSGSGRLTPSDMEALPPKSVSRLKKSVQKQPAQPVSVKRSVARPQPNSASTTSALGLKMTQSPKQPSQSQSQLQLQPIISTALGPLNVSELDQHVTNLEYLLGRINNLNRQIMTQHSGLIKETVQGVQAQALEGVKCLQELHDQQVSWQTKQIEEMQSVYLGRLEKSKAFEQKKKSVMENGTSVNGNEKNDVPLAPSPAPSSSVSCFESVVVDDPEQADGKKKIRMKVKRKSMIPVRKSSSSSLVADKKKEEQLDEQQDKENTNPDAEKSLEILNKMVEVESDLLRIVDNVETIKRSKSPTRVAEAEGKKKQLLNTLETAVQGFESLKANFFQTAWSPLDELLVEAETRKKQHQHHQHQLKQQHETPFRLNTSVSSVSSVTSSPALLGPFDYRQFSNSVKTIQKVLNDVVVDGRDKFLETPLKNGDGNKEGTEDGVEEESEFGKIVEKIVKKTCNQNESEVDELLDEERVKGTVGKWIRKADFEQAAEAHQKVPAPVTIPTLPTSSAFAPTGNDATKRSAIQMTLAKFGVQDAGQEPEVIQVGNVLFGKKSAPTGVRKSMAAAKPPRPPVSSSPSRSVSRQQQQQQPQYSRPVSPSKSRTSSPTRSRPSSPLKPPNFYNVRLSNMPIFLRRTTIRPPTLRTLPLSSPDRPASPRKVEFAESSHAPRQPVLEGEMERHIQVQTTQQASTTNKSTQSAPLPIEKVLIADSGTQKVEHWHEGTQTSIPEPSFEFPQEEGENIRLSQAFGTQYSTPEKRRSPSPQPRRQESKQLEKDDSLEVEYPTALEFTKPATVTHQDSFTMTKMDTSTDPLRRSKLLMENRITDWIRQQLMIKLLANEKKQPPAPAPVVQQQPPAPIHVTPQVIFAAPPPPPPIIRAEKEVMTSMQELVETREEETQVFIEEPESESESEPVPEPVVEEIVIVEIPKVEVRESSNQTNPSLYDQLVSEAAFTKTLNDYAYELVQQTVTSETQLVVREAVAERAEELRRELEELERLERLRRQQEKEDAERRERELRELRALEAELERQRQLLREEEDRRRRAMDDADTARRALWELANKPVSAPVVNITQQAPVAHPPPSPVFIPIPSVQTPAPQNFMERVVVVERGNSPKTESLKEEVVRTPPPIMESKGITVFVQPIVSEKETQVQPEVQHESVAAMTMSEPEPVKMPTPPPPKVESPPPKESTTTTTSTLMSSMSLSEGEVVADLFSEGQFIPPMELNALLAGGLSTKTRGDKDKKRGNRSSSSSSRGPDLKFYLPNVFDVDAASIGEFTGIKPDDGKQGRREQQQQRQQTRARDDVTSMGEMDESFGEVEKVVKTRGDVMEVLTAVVKQDDETSLGEDKDGDVITEDIDIATKSPPPATVTLTTATTRVIRSNNASIINEVNDNAQDVLRSLSRKSASHSSLSLVADAPKPTAQPNEVDADNLRSMLSRLSSFRSEKSIEKLTTAEPVSVIEKRESILSMLSSLSSPCSAPGSSNQSVTNDAKGFGGLTQEGSYVGDLSSIERVSDVVSDVIQL